MKRFTTELHALHEKLDKDLEFFCRKCLRIKTKDAKIVPFVWNTAQRYIHEQIEEQLAEIGMVRVVILKGRQQGCSTYVGARYFKKAAWTGATTVYILTHENGATQNLFGKVKLYHMKCPDSVKPTITVENRTKLVFDNLSEYLVGTAGSKNSGRSLTVQLFHGSEVGFYENPDEIQTGVMQTVADMPGTEIILESTANGVSDLGAYFYQTVMDALAGRGKFKLIFVPWYWQEEYRAKVPANWVFSEKELEIKDTYGLDNEQLYWRYLKIIELKAEWKFRQEYPFTVQEAFQTSTTSFINSIHVQRARKADIEDLEAPLVLGVDPGRTGDRTVLAYRRGRKVIEIKTYDEMDQMQLSGIIANAIDRRGVVKVFMDYGMGYGTVDRLHELGYVREVTGVHFGEKASEPQYLNKRAEMAFALRDWLADGEVSIPDDEAIEVDLLSVPDFKTNSRGLLSLESKDNIRKASGFSPDIFDAIMLTFAFPVHRDLGNPERKVRRTENTKKGSALSALNRIRNMNKEDDSSISWGPAKPRTWRKAD